MAMVQWQSVCSRCGKAGPKISKPENLGRPTTTPPILEGNAQIAQMESISLSGKKHN